MVQVFIHDYAEEYARSLERYAFENLQMWDGHAAVQLTNGLARLVPLYGDDATRADVVAFFNGDPAILQRNPPASNDRDHECADAFNLIFTSI